MNSSILFEKPKNWVSATWKSTRTEFESAKTSNMPRQLKAAGVSTIYLQFDGLTSDVYKFIRGVDLLETKMKAIQNLREAGIHSVVLVVTLVKGVNDGQLGDIVNFALENFDVIRCVNVQPVSLCGRLPQQEREKMRITIPDFMRLVEEQTNGMIKASDFYPVPTVAPVAKAVGALKDKRYIEFTAHPHCGMATYLFVENGKTTPITRIANVEKFVSAMKKVYEEAKKGNKNRAKLRLVGAAQIREVQFPPQICSASANRRQLRELRRPATEIASAHLHALHGPVQL